jgi:hypothetical protein
VHLVSSFRRLTRIDPVSFSACPVSGLADLSDENLLSGSLWSEEQVSWGARGAVSRIHISVAPGPFLNAALSADGLQQGVYHFRKAGIKDLTTPADRVLR